MCAMKGDQKIVWELNTLYLMRLLLLGSYSEDFLKLFNRQ